MEKKEFKVLVPPIKSQGKKTKLVSWIKKVKDEIKKERNIKSSIYVEPFIGTGVVGFNIAGKNAVFSDTNIHLIKFYNAIKSKELTSEKVRLYLEEESKKLKATGIDKNSYYYEVRDRFNKLGSSYDFLFLTRACFNGMMRFSRKGYFNVPFCKKPERFSPSYITKIVNQVKWLEEKIEKNNWEFIVSDFKDIINKYKNKKNVIMYLDPPYIGRHTDYFNGWGDKEETELANLLKETKHGFILSTWYGNQYRKNEYIKKCWQEYDILKKEHFYHVGANVENRSPVIEALVVKR